MTDPIAELHSAYDDRLTLPGNLSDVIGYLTPSAPIELIFAAGLRPWRLHGRPDRPPSLGDRYMEEVVDGTVRSLFDQFLSGDFAGLPLVLMSRASEPYLQLTYYLDEALHWGDYDLPPRHLVDVMQTPNWHTGRYVKSRLQELGEVLGQFGTPISDVSLATAIQEVNAMRRALQRVNALRRAGRIAGSDLFRAVSLFGSLPPERFIALMDRLSETASDPMHGPRIMLSGAAQDDPALYQLIEAAGGVVAADDHVHGERVFATLVDETADPWDALSEYYQLHAPGVRQHPQAAQDARFIATCDAAQIDGDLCVLEDCDDTLGWDWPARRDLLAARGVPSHLMTGDHYFTPNTDARAAAIRDLLDRIKGGTS